MVSRGTDCLNQNVPLNPETAKDLQLSSLRLKVLSLVTFSYGKSQTQTREARTVYRFPCTCHTASSWRPVLFYHHLHGALPLFRFSWFTISEMCPLWTLPERDLESPEDSHQFSNTRLREILLQKIQLGVRESKTKFPTVVFTVGVEDRS